MHPTTIDTPRSPPPKKRLGQHFLTDPQVAHAIVTAAEIRSTDRVVEIGPGLGALTTGLLRTTGRLWAIELDEDLIPALQKRTTGLGELQLKRCDALKVDYRELAREAGGELSIVANLPYNISTPLLLRFLEQRDAIARMTLMVQTEVADRITAAPGTKAYGALSIPCGLWMHLETVLQVPPSAFRPPPKVNSTVIRLTRRTHPLVELHNPERFFQVVRAAFGQRRKVLANALGILCPSPRTWLEKACIDPQRRGETLSIAEFAHLASTPF